MYCSCANRSLTNSAILYCPVSYNCNYWGMLGNLILKVPSESVSGMVLGSENMLTVDFVSRWHLFIQVIWQTPKITAPIIQGLTFKPKYMYRYDSFWYMYMCSDKQIKVRIIFFITAFLTYVYVDYANPSVFFLSLYFPTVVFKVVMDNGWFNVPLDGKQTKEKTIVGSCSLTSNLILDLLITKMIFRQRKPIEKELTS